MQKRASLLDSYEALIAVLEEHARALSLAIVDLSAEGDDAAADALALLRRGHRVRIIKLRGDAAVLLNDQDKSS